MKISRNSFEIIQQKINLFNNEMLFKWNSGFDKQKQIDMLQDIIQEIEENDHLCFVN